MASSSKLETLANLVSVIQHARMVLDTNTGLNDQKTSRLFLEKYQGLNVAFIKRFLELDLNEESQVEVLLRKILDEVKEDKKVVLTKNKTYQEQILALLEAESKLASNVEKTKDISFWLNGGAGPAGVVGPESSNINLAFSGSEASGPIGFIKYGGEPVIHGISIDPDFTRVGSGAFDKDLNKVALITLFQGPQGPSPEESKTAEPIGVNGAEDPAPKRKYKSFKKASTENE